MTSSNDRLTEVENDLETVKEIMLAIARRAEATDARIDRLVQNQASTQEQIDSNASAIAQLTEAQETTQAYVDVLVTALDELARRQDESRSEIRRILNYLENQSGNGRGGTGDEPQP